MGRPPTAPQVKILNGTHRRDRHGDAAAIMAEVSLAEVPPSPPEKCQEFLSRWLGYCQVLIGAGVLTERDLGCIEMLCDAHVMLKSAADSLREHGDYSIDKRGQLKPHPALVRKEQAIKMILQYQSQLGLTPAARAKVAPIQRVRPPKGVSSLRVTDK